MTGGQIGNVDLVKQLNGAAVYRLIDQQGPISRIQIAEISRLAPASITKITRHLLERGLIKELAQQASTGGRRAISLTTQSAPFHSLAVRLGRKKIEIGLFDLSGKLISKHEENFYYPDQKTLSDGLVEHLHQFLFSQQKKLNELIAVAISLPGLINAETGMVDYMPHIPIDKLPLSELIRLEFNVQCFIGNDSRSHALAEHYFGISKAHSDSILISVHNGTGAGIIVNGDVFLGHNRNAGEIGHIQIDPLGKRCQCGNFGCLETVASNPAILEHAQHLLAMGHKSKLQTKKDALTLPDICKAALSGDEMSRQILLNVGHHLGKALAITINLFNPQQIVISGEITQAQEIVFPAIQHCIRNQSLSAFHNDLPIVSSTLSKMPTLGAFALVKRAMLNGTLLQILLDD